MERYGLDVQRTAVGAEPATLSGVKSLCGVDFADDDALITRLCTSARLEAEAFCGRVFVDSEIRVFAQYWSGAYELPYGPVNGDLDSITDADEVAISDYTLRGVGFKKLDVYAPDGIYLTYNSYGECPQDVISAIEMLAAMKYDMSFAEKFKTAAFALLTPYRRTI